MVNPLAQVAGEEKAVCLGGAQRGQEPKLRHPDILRLVHNGESEWSFAAGGDLFAEAAEEIGIRDRIPGAEAGADAL